MNIKEFREKAIKRYKNGESPKEIYQSLGYGKPGYLNAFALCMWQEKLTEK